MQYVKWEQDISLLAAAFGIPKAQLAEGVLSFSAYQEMLKQRPGTRSETKAVEAQYVEYKARWQTVNTALYWHVRPSLDIDGVHFLADSRALEDLCRPPHTLLSPLVSISLIPSPPCDHC